MSRLTLAYLSSVFFLTFMVELSVPTFESTDLADQESKLEWWGMGKP